MLQISGMNNVSVLLYWYMCVSVASYPGARGQVSANRILKVRSSNDEPGPAVSSHGNYICFKRLDG